MPEIEIRPGRVVRIGPLQVEAHVARKPDGRPKVHGVSRDIAPLDLRVGEQVDVHIDSTQHIVAVTRPGEQPPSAETTRRPVNALDARAGAPRGADPRSRGVPAAAGGGRAAAVPPRRRGEFLNPYAMIPAPPRRLGDPYLRDRPGPGHDVLVPGHWSGTIPLTITTETPLLVLDQGAVATGQPLPVRRSRTGAPILEWTALKGALRSVVEAATNSRFAVVDDAHENALALRQPADAALDLLPACVDSVPSEDAEGECTVVTVLEPRRYPTCPRDAFPTGTSPHEPEPVRPDVWVPARGSSSLVRGYRPGDEVDAWIRLMVHPAVAAAGGRAGQSAFWHWRAVDVAGVGSLPEVPSAAPPLGTSLPTDLVIAVRGRLILGGLSFPRKHDERLFVTEVRPAHPDVRFEVERLPVSRRVAHAWTAVYDSYGRAAEENPSKHPGRHVRDLAKERLLSPGRLCFARLGVAGRETVLDALFPVLIGREAFALSPREVLGEEHRPAREDEELSPADRLFGWARTERRGPSGRRGVDAYRGHVRGERITCESGAEAVESFPRPLWLSTLNSPKPEQYRFRLSDGDGRPLPSGVRRAATEGYAPGRSLGRTAYWPHRGLPTGYWDWSDARPAAGEPNEVGYLPSEVGRRFREYLAPPGTKKKVTQQISGWVRPGTTFTTVLRVENVEERALGVLLWFMTKGDFSFTIGGGKPLGFGTVTIRADLAAARLCEASARRASYGAWDAVPGVADEGRLMQVARDARARLQPECADAVEAMGRGDGRFPVHYPRRGDPQTRTSLPVATSYEWFVQNERGARLSLPAPTDPDPALPYL